MANRTAKVVVVGLIASIGPAARAASGSEPAPTIVVHLSDPQEAMGTRDRELLQALVVEVYAKAGVRIEWSSTGRPTVGRRLELVVLGAAAADRQVPERHHFGIAVRAVGRAYVCHSRIVAHAFRSGGNPTRALALVVIHELGHLLLPEPGHTPSGVMRADWEGSLRRIPVFTPAQAATLRATASSLP